MKIDGATEGTFVWLTGEPLVYKNWDKNEPNDFFKNEDCAVISSNGTWGDNGCGAFHYAVCEIDEPLKK